MEFEFRLITHWISNAGAPWVTKVKVFTRFRKPDKYFTVFRDPFYPNPFLTSKDDAINDVTRYIFSMFKQ